MLLLLLLLGVTPADLSTGRQWIDHRRRPIRSDPILIATGQEIGCRKIVSDVTYFIGPVGP